MDHKLFMTIFCCCSTSIPFFLLLLLLLAKVNSCEFLHGFYLLMFDFPLLWLYSIKYQANGNFCSFIFTFNTNKYTFFFAVCNFPWNLLSFCISILNCFCHSFHSSKKTKEGKNENGNNIISVFDTGSNT